MCILFATRAHPNYELILISNRDEFFERDTHCTCWHSNNQILSPYDMAKKRIDCKDDSALFGTWIGVSKNGNIANILNLRLESTINLKSLVTPKSRGIIPFTFLSSNSSTSPFIKWDSYEKFDSKYNNIEYSGDFNFFYGTVTDKSYRIIDSLGHTFNVLNENNPSFVLSNDIYKDENSADWNKVKIGHEDLKMFLQETKNIIDDNIIIEKCFDLSSKCSIGDGDHTKPYRTKPEKTYETIFVPPLGTDDTEDIGLTVTKGNVYGTRSQIVILVSKDSKHVTFEEKVLYTKDSDLNKYSLQHPKKTKRFEFDIE